MAKPNTWSENASLNADADSTINFVEGQAANTLNNSCRGVMAGVAGFKKDVSGQLISTGSATAFALTTYATYDNLLDGERFRFRAHVSNTGASTATINFLPSVTIVRIDGTALQAGDIKINEIYELIYVSASTHFRLAKYFSLSADISDATALGRALMTAANAGAAQTALALVPGTNVQAYSANLAAFSGKTAPTGAVVGDSDTQSVSNKTIGNTNSATLKAGSFTLQDDADTTKQARFNLSAFLTGTIPVFYLPQATGYLVTADSGAVFSNKQLSADQLRSAQLAANVGFSATSYGIGTITGGTVSLAASNGNFQHYTNNGAHTLAPPSSVCSMIVQVLNGASAGAINTSGFTKVAGDSLTTTNASKFQLSIVVTQTYASLTVLALQ